MNNEVMGIIDVIIDDFICYKKYDKTFNQLLKFIYFVFDNKITSKQKLNGTITVYSIKDNNFGSAGLAWGYAHTITRNFIFVAAILIVNIMTFS